MEARGRPQGRWYGHHALEVVLGILTADCAPVLFADPGNRVIAAAHAGWRGALGGIADRTIDVMLSAGAEREKIVAAIGPAICQRVL